VKIDANDIDEYGGRLNVLSADLLCSFQSASSVKYDKDKQPVCIAAKAYFDGDICPSVDYITSGTVKIAETVYTIYRGTKARNPDGTVNYTLLELM
jgi:hypothetical protein